MAKTRGNKKKKKTTNHEGKVYVPWKRSGFRFDPFPPAISKNVLDNVFAALAIRPDAEPSMVRARMGGLLIGCLTATSKNPPKTNLMTEDKAPQAAYYNAVLEAVRQHGISGGGLTPKTTSTQKQQDQQQTLALPNNSGPDLGKLHWTTIAIMIHVFTTARRLFVDQANDEKERMVYKKQQQQKGKQPEKPGESAGTAKEIIADDSDDDSNEGQGGSRMSIEKDTDEENMFVTQRPGYEPRAQTAQENRLVSLVDVWIQHLDAVKGLALRNEDIETMELF